MIQSYHAHIYFQGLGDREKAERLRARIAARFLVQLGRWHDQLVGPHEWPMYQVAFNPEVFADFVPWLMLNRDGLVILLHPNTGRPRDDHLVHAVWFGRVLEIQDVEGLPEVSDEDERAVVNTAPDVGIWVS